MEGQEGFPVVVTLFDLEAEPSLQSVSYQPPTPTPAKEKSHGQGVLKHTVNPSGWETEVSDFMSSRPA